MLVNKSLFTTFGFGIHPVMNNVHEHARKRNVINGIPLMNMFVNESSFTTRRLRHTAKAVGFVINQRFMSVFVNNILVYDICRI